MASAMPSGSPMATQNTSEVSTSDSVTMASLQMPSMPTSSSETTAPMAMPRPANCQASRPSTPTIASIGVPVSRPSIQARVLSIGTRTLWKKGRKLSTTQVRPWLIQASSGSDPSQSCCS